jgi:hypothetical protein
VSRIAALSEELRPLPPRTAAIISSGMDVQSRGSSGLGRMLALTQKRRIRSNGHASLVSTRELRLVDMVLVAALSLCSSLIWSTEGFKIQTRAKGACS